MSLTAGNGGSLRSRLRLGRPRALDVLGEEEDRQQARGQAGQTGPLRGTMRAGTGNCGPWTASA